MIIKKITIIFIIILTILGGGIYAFIKEKIILPKFITNQKNKTGYLFCLSEDEQAEFKINHLGEYPSVEYDKGFVEVVVKELSSDKEIIRFKINNIISPSHYHPVEIHQCGVYVIRTFNYDPKKTKQEPGYKNELWIYNYNGRGEPLILLAEKPKEFISYYSPDFRVSPAESYIVLEKGYSGKDDYSLVIKNLNTKEDIFTLPSKELQRMNSNFIGVFDMLEWSEDGQYFWGSVSDGAYVNGYFRIDTQNWKTDIYKAPDGAMGGSPLNINTGYLPVQPGQVWTGDYQLTEDLKKQYKKEGKKSQLYLYNLFTKEKTLVETTDEPLFWFKPKWLSDTQLEYELPTGEKKVYEVIVK
ncbi:hypothetical protein KJ934_02240 [Patescibacteria group bacterium]|nr:hypothetical protein [Patescibacteria group bacterium]MBU4353588.1 hypothetical protein [Patescibacteria group bacterium]MBU4476903.1 hypothetical protein [Patescibacteria group bacterium]MCG2699076.1 hypothetical protein [Candidatus Parcubacteria bacterium]